MKSQSINPHNHALKHNGGIIILTSLNPKPDAIIRVRFLLTEECRRKTYIDTTYNEYHTTIGIDKTHFDCRFVDNESKIYKLGEWHSVRVKFLSPDLALPHFATDKPLTLWEGKTIA